MAVEGSNRFELDVVTYRPRIESAFARIERWIEQTSGDQHWRVTTRDNISHVLGRDPTARIADPNDGRRIYRWLLQESRDARGNIIRYDYKAEDAANVDRSTPFERNRLEADAQRYLKRIRYTNLPNSDQFAFHLLFDYGEHDNSLREERPWPVRPDSFSTFRSGFELERAAFAGGS